MTDVIVRQAVVTAPTQVVLQRVPIPEPGLGEVRVRMSVVGICGSDVHASHGRHPFVPLPYHPGHEVVGTVDATGPGAEMAAGTRVVVEPILACGRCKYCLDGRYNLCATMSFFGCTAPTGGLADQFLLSTRRSRPGSRAPGRLRLADVRSGGCRGSRRRGRAQSGAGCPS